MNDHFAEKTLAVINQVLEHYGEMDQVRRIASWHTDTHVFIVFEKLSKSFGLAINIVDESPTGSWGLTPEELGSEIAHLWILEPDSIFRSDVTPGQILWIRKPHDIALPETVDQIVNRSN